jgi:hypothetical protein
VADPPGLRRCEWPTRPGFEHPPSWAALRPAGRSVSGAASDDSRVAGVGLAVLRVRAPRDRPSVACGFAPGARGFARRGLPAGRYLVYSRASDDRGARERRFSARDRNRLSFTVRPSRSPSRRPSGG